ncbi:MAG: N,N-dimethylformamidase beta subunit family domain-containing protein, partial [Pseudomonadota bacterium]
AMGADEIAIEDENRIMVLTEGGIPEASEEQLTHNLTSTGEPAKDLIRADMIFYETGGGGAVFSVGSITFCGALPWNGCDNNISRLLGNVIRRFMDPDPDFGSG